MDKIIKKIKMIIINKINKNKMIIYKIIMINKINSKKIIVKVNNKIKKK